MRSRKKLHHFIEDISMYKVNKKSINLHFVLTTKKSEIVIQTHVKITIIITFEILIYWYIVR